RKGTNDNDYYLEWYFLPDPTVITTPSNPDQNNLANAPYVKLGLETVHDNYVSGYIVSVQRDETYPDIWAPLLTTGGSSSTYFCDNASLVLSSVARSLRFGGHWYYGAYDGLSLAFASLGTSIASALFGADLCFAQ
ncbi:MAG: hypothetical protein VZR73_14870, partial [Acutalibacteraceae bacterium]|nr:hypothetical protein [Acutalibacteraceae bacterium]